MSASSFAVRLSVFYAGLFVIYGAQVPFLPVWLAGEGLDARQVALVTAAPFLLRLGVTPACALVADRLSAHRRMILLLAWTGVGAVLLLDHVHGFPAILAASLIFSLATASIMPLTETIAVAGSRVHHVDYGRMRLWGSLSFVAIGLLGGALLDRFGAVAALWLLIAGAVATALAAHGLPRPAENGGQKASRLPLISPETKRLVRSPVFLAFLVAASTAQASHALFYTFGALHLQAQGITGTAIGLLWAIAVIAEVVLFAFAGRVYGRVGPCALLAAGALAAMVRWSLMSLDPPLWGLAGLQALHAITFGATHLGAMRFISEVAPSAVAGTAQALHSSFAAGVVMGLATLASGTLYEAYAGSAFAAMAVLGAISLMATLFILRRWDGRQL